MARKHGLILVLAAIVAATSVARPQASHAATTINVPADYPTIQTAIAAAVNGDTIVVSPGTYPEHIDFIGKAIEVRSMTPHAAIIDGTSYSASGIPAVTFSSGETSGSVLRGMTVRGARTAAFVVGSSPLLEGNLFTENLTLSALFISAGSPSVLDNDFVLNQGFFGGAIDIEPGSSPTIRGNLFDSNVATIGGAIYIAYQLTGYTSNTLIVNNLFTNNAAAPRMFELPSTANRGGAIWADGTTGETIAQNVFYGNSSIRGDTINVSDGPLRLIDNTIVSYQGPTITLGNGSDRLVANNVIVSYDGAAIFCEFGPNQPVLIANDAYAPSVASAFTGACSGASATNGNITADPQFIGPETDNYRIGPGSPAVDAGNVLIGPLQTVDFDGLARISGVTLDQGAFEFQTPPTATPTASATGTQSPSPTFTTTPTNTPTPIVPGINKIPEGNAANADLSVPKANLWLCQSPAPCAGPGEGNLRVVEQASNVFSDYDSDATLDAIDPDITGTSLSNTEFGLGAYEFSVEYDNFVIQSVNPCDIVFGPGGAGSTRGPVDELNTSSPANPDCTPDPNAANNGTCSMSLVLENIIHFGCVTNGEQQGPSGDFDLASLNLIPHPDLANDIFPGNDNGVLTVLKDNGCELVDVFGHPVIGSVNGGLTPVCGDLAVTVRILEGDMNLDCTVDVTDEQLISFRYGAFFGDVFYQKWYDLEPALHDLDIDIKDLQKVFGRDGSTCQSPIPDQAPLDPPAPFGD